MAAVNMINRVPLSGAALAAVLAAMLAGCGSTHPSKETSAPPKGDATALTVIAEADLKRGDCRAASETYAKAAAVGDVQLARRATQVAMACEHLPAAWSSATRWRALAPGDREADALYAAVALKLYRTTEARAAINDFWRVEEQQAGSGTAQPKSPAAATPAPPASASPGAAPGSGGVSPAHAQDRAAKSMTDLTALLLEESDAPAVLTAMSGALEPTANSPQTYILLGELALAAYNGQRAQGYAQRALQLEPNDPAALRVLARSFVVRGDAPQAVATARRAEAGDSTRGGFELAEILASLDRSEEAHQELEHLRTRGAPQAEIDRRLALLAYNSGDMKEARQRFSELISNGEGNDAAQLYLADISAREGDPEAAIASYRRLYDSSVALSARSRAAALLLDKSARTEAIALLDDYAADHPEEELDLTLAKARLLADHGDADGGLSVLSTALERHPQHPSIEYDRAVILEQAGHVHESVAALEQMLKERPDDPTLLNALGYTLADHTLELPHAESLIRRALVAMPDNPAAIDSLGWVQFRQGDAHGAAATLERAYSLGHDGEIAAHWGEALWISGQQNEARRVWAAALAREPDSKPLKATIKRLIPDAH
ncbi:MAG TPA: tetratricopeptide repeat protein [Steroidobacteraceae bacterium]|nr:tetratricopeptide repeat protein [Steroidobacteraceae bacterium]